MTEQKTTGAALRRLLDERGPGPGGRVLVLTGAGMSRESGIATFRDPDGIWAKYDPMDLATPQAFARDPEFLWRFYDARRVTAKRAEPHGGHAALVRLEDRFDRFDVVTQNVDGLHQRSGNGSVTELHGSFWRVRCTRCPKESVLDKAPLDELPPRCDDCGGLLRPGVVWFGEALPEDAIREASRLAGACDLAVVVGTSAQVYPAAALPLTARQAGAPVIEINPAATDLSPLADLHLPMTASAGLEALDEVVAELQS